MRRLLDLALVFVCMLSAPTLTLAAGPPAAAPEVIDAWYGTDALHWNDNGVVPQKIRNIIQLNNGRIVLDGNLFGLFGFDPAYGQHKLCEMHVRYNGRDHYLRVEEGQPFSFPGGAYVDLVNAWYGTEWQHDDRNGNVSRQIRDIIQRNNGRIVLDGNLFGLFGFDPAPGQHKVCAMRIRYNGQEHHLRVIEGHPFSFPSATYVDLQSAWYGTDALHGGDNGGVNQRIRDIIQRNYGRIVLDGNLFGLFRFDPAYGQHKVCAMHVRYNGQEHYLRVEEGERFTFPVLSFGAHVELLDAWYGTDTLRSNYNGVVAQKIREINNHNYDRIVLDGNLRGLFGFDPAPVREKLCEMLVRYNGTEHRLRAKEGQPFGFPSRAYVELLDAWYGTESQHSDNNGRVNQQIRDIIQRNNGRIELDGNLFGLFGFDPAFGQHKVCGMLVRYNGQEHHLRAKEGQPFSFPSGAYVELLNAWYGTESQHGNDYGRFTTKIREIIQRNYGRIVLPGNDETLFGNDYFSHDLMAMHVRYNGKEHHLRVGGWQPFSFPGGAYVEVLHAWYGTELLQWDNNGLVTQQIRDIVDRNNGNIVLDGNLFGLFGFDPVPGQHKVCEMHVRYSFALHVLRAKEGQPFSFPA